MGYFRSTTIIDRLPAETAARRCVIPPAEQAAPLARPPNATDGSG
jgi:hypothetical protein